ncbi:MAG: hypothetical protein M3O35_11560 [Acidobacteriota bacterium]|nr:hypothetical protein [Acidobacteriota bacterium]
MNPNLPLSDFSVQTLIGLMQAELQRQADKRNADAIGVFNDQVAFHNGPKGGADPVPVPPLLELVHDDEIAAAMRGEKRWDESKVVTYYRYQPPVPVPPVLPAAPVNPVGMPEGHWNGHDYYQVLPGDPRPVGASYSHPVLGWLLKVWIMFPMTDGYPMWQTTDPPLIKTAA